MTAVGGSASSDGPRDRDELIYCDSTRTGFIPVGLVVSVPIILMLIAVDLRWWIAVLVTVPLALTVTYLAMPSRELRLGLDYLALREGRRPEVRLALSEIEEIERVWVLRAGYHLELRGPELTIEILGLGSFSKPFLHEVGARLLPAASPELHLGQAERELLGLS